MVYKNNLTFHMVRTILLVVVPLDHDRVASQMYKIDSLTRIPLMSLFATCPLYFGRRGPCNMSFLLWKKTRAALQPRKMHAWHGMAWTGCGGTLTWRVETREGRRGLTLAGRSQAWCSVVCTSSYNCHYCVYYCIYMLHHMRACVRVPAHRSIDANMKSGRQGYGGWMDRSR